MQDEGGGIKHHSAIQSCPIRPSNHALHTSTMQKLKYTSYIHPFKHQPPLGDRAARSQHPINLFPMMFSHPRTSHDHLPFLRAHRRASPLSQFRTTKVLCLLSSSTSSDLLSANRRLLIFLKRGDKVVFISAFGGNYILEILECGNTYIIMIFTSVLRDLHHIQESNKPFFFLLSSRL